MNHGGRRGVVTEFDDGGEMIEEYDLKTDELLLRKRRGRTVLGKDEEWEYLTGEAPRTFSPDVGILAESSVNPTWQRSQDTPAELRVESAKSSLPDRDVPGDVRSRRPEDRHQDDEQEVLQAVRRPGAQGAEVISAGPVSYTHLTLPTTPYV